MGGVGIQVIVAVHQYPNSQCEDNWHLTYVRASADKQLLPEMEQ